jgi:hypothetical protein
MPARVFQEATGLAANRNATFLSQKKIVSLAERLV